MKGLFAISWFIAIAAMLVILFTGCARLRVAGIHYYDCSNDKCRLAWAYDRVMYASESHCIAGKQWNLIASKGYREVAAVLLDLYKGKDVSRAHIADALRWMRGVRATHHERFHSFDHVIRILESELHE